MKSEITEKFTTLITTAFGLIAALAWNDAIKALFQGPCGSKGAGSLCVISSKGPWVYAIIITILAVVVTMWFAKVSKKAK